MDSYQRKKAKIAADKPKYLALIEEELRDIQEDVVGQSTALVQAVKSFLTPEFILRMRNRRIQEGIVQETVE